MPRAQAAEEEDEEEVEEIAAPAPKPRFDPGKSTRSVDPVFQQNQEERCAPPPDITRLPRQKSAGCINCSISDGDAGVSISCHLASASVWSASVSHAGPVVRVN